MLERGKALTLAGLLFSLLSACSSNNGNASDDSCAPDDQDGVSGGNNTVLLSVSDSAFAVGGPNSGSTEPNIAVQNSSQVTLTLSNVGTVPHGLHIACIPSNAPAGCPATSCFPSSADVPALAPGDSATTTFTTPAVEGAYPFSDAPGDSSAPADAGVGGLVGEFVLM